MSLKVGGDIQAAGRHLGGISVLMFSKALALCMFPQEERGAPETAFGGGQYL